MENTMISGSLPWSDGSGLSYNDQYAELASAIVFQAVKDYIKVLRALWKKGQTQEKKRKLIDEKTEIEEFFHSEWYGFLTDMDPSRLLSQCRWKAMEQEKEAIRKQNKRKIKQLLKGAAGKDGTPQ